MLPVVFGCDTGLISTEPASGSMCMDTMRVSIWPPLDGFGSGNIVAAFQGMVYLFVYEHM